MRLLLSLLAGLSIFVDEAGAQSATQSQDSAVAAIKKLGGKVVVDLRLKGSPVVRVDFRRQNVSDAALDYVRTFPNL